MQLSVVASWGDRVLGIGPLVELESPDSSAVRGFEWVANGGDSPLLLTPEHGDETAPRFTILIDEATASLASITLVCLNSNSSLAEARFDDPNAVAPSATVPAGEAEDPDIPESTLLTLDVRDLGCPGARQLFLRLFRRRPKSEFRLYRVSVVVEMAKPEPQPQPAIDALNNTALLDGLRDTELRLGSKIDMLSTALLDGLRDMEVRLGSKIDLSSTRVASLERRVALLDRDRSTRLHWYRLYRFIHTPFLFIYGWLKKMRIHFVVAVGSFFDEY